ncbi:hypothetical protein AGABI2DRAFT_176339 [Agaricus bisporus var. bisporus H97]|uniref:hypothetical protein n=1 Tax=Agaricus bisporus var. bisporus (strain H97 / ATCC MYA-4626 / FGSC 10389) TaxID=936046 RepID=UPI00029F6C34|nr:hypothetical protein AGABI2DRAFT_176339 [Agaricus bisporus var. bisporus H97]EKV49676.1 hypothetical protein AGABI2DRAFT_176339 [Agaricus bisporus var. bisporus H97]
MVNDDKDRDLICWSDAGDSFFVLDHERFAREVLGHWFKHQRFSSFVRQLNMYGFHKIPHLQQGVLRSDSDTEYWNFSHPNFRRDQPDLLCLIQRKKQSTAAPQDGVVNLRDPNTPTSNVPDAPSSPSPTLSLTQGQLLDMHSILQGIAAIKRHQTTISSELTELKQNNQLLYSESLVARNKLQKQQELIDRILKFLAGVFGNSAHAGSNSSGNGHHSKRNASSDELDDLMRGSDANRAVIPRRRQSSTGRLMIEGAKVSEGSGKPGIVEVEDIREDDDAYAVETPISIPSPSPSESAIRETKDRPDSTPTAPPPPVLDRALTPTHHHNNFEINQSWTNALGGRNGIPNDQLTHLLAVLAQNNNNSTTTGIDEPLVGFEHGEDLGLGFEGGDFGGQGVVQPGQIQAGQSSSSSTTGNQLTFPPPPTPGGFDFASFLQNLSPPPSAGLPQQQQQQQSGLSPFGLLQDSLHHSLNDESGGGLVTLDSPPPPHVDDIHGSLIERQVRSTKEVEKEVGEMDRQMKNWIEQLGPILGSADAGGGGGGSLDGVGGGGGVPVNATTTTTTTEGLDELDFDSILRDMNISTSQQGHGEDESGFGEEDEEEEESAATTSTSTTTNGNGSRKRKSDVMNMVMDEDEDEDGVNTRGGKTKRRK